MGVRDSAADLIPEDQGNAARNYLMPIGLKRRPSLKRIIRKWPRAVEWLTDLVEIAREALAGGKLLACGETLSLEDLETHNSDNAIDPEFLQSLIKTDFLVFDQAEGCYALLRWRDFYRFASDSKEANAQRKREERLRKELADAKQKLSLLEKNANVTTESRQCHEPVTACHDLPEPEPEPEPGPDPGPGPLPSPDPDPDARAREDEGVASLREGEADGRCAPPPGENPSSPKVNSSANTAPTRLQSWAADTVAQLRLSKRLAPGERRKLGIWIAEAARDQPEEALRWAVCGAVAETQHEIRTSSIGDGFALCFSMLERHLNAALLQRGANEISRARGRPPAAYVWRPPEAEAAS